MDAGIIEVFVAGLAVALTWYFSRRAEFQLSNWLTEVRAWASECVDALAEARVAFDNDDGETEAARRKRVCAARLSALLDRGRFFLPNEPRENPDDRLKPLAYRGYRNAALDPLMAGIRVLNGTEPVTEPSKVIFELQREFVSEVYRVLRPDHYSRRIAKMIRGSILSRQTDPSVGGLLPGGEVPRGATTVLRQAVARVEQRQNEALPNPPST